MFEQIFSPCTSFVDKGRRRSRTFQGIMFQWDYCLDSMLLTLNAHLRLLSTIKKKKSGNPWRNFWRIYFELTVAHQMHAWYPYQLTVPAVREREEAGYFNESFSGGIIVGTQCYSMNARMISLSTLFYSSAWNRPMSQLQQNKIPKSSNSRHFNKDCKRHNGTRLLSYLIDCKFGATCISYPDNQP